MTPCLKNKMINKQTKTMTDEYLSVGRLSFRSLLLWKIKRLGGKEGFWLWFSLICRVFFSMKCPPVFDFEGLWSNFKTLHVKWNLYITFRKDEGEGYDWNLYDSFSLCPWSHLSGVWEGWRRWGCSGRTSSAFTQPSSPTFGSVPNPGAQC